MKIGIFTDCYYPQINGVVTSVMMMKEELERRGHQVFIITVKVPGHVDEDPGIIRIRSVPFHKWKEFRLALPFFFQVYQQLLKLDLDLIHTHTEFSIGLFGKYFARLHKIPRLHTYHTMYEDYAHYILPFNRGKRVAVRLIKRHSKNYVKKYDAIIAPSQKTKEALIRYGVENAIFVVPTGIDIASFKRHPASDPEMVKIRETLSIKDEDHVVLSLGRISQEKSIDAIIRQMPNLLKTIPGAKLVIVGDGPYRRELEKLAASLELGDRVVFAGRVERERVPFYYSLAEVFVSASRTETQGLTILEAMASGTPVAVWDDENIKGVVADQVSGRVFGSEEELTMCLQDMLSFPQLNEKLARNAMDVVKRLSREAFGDNTEEIYEKLAKRSGKVQDKRKE